MFKVKNKNIWRLQLRLSGVFTIKFEHILHLFLLCLLLTLSRYTFAGNVDVFSQQPKRDGSYLVFKVSLHNCFNSHHANFMRKYFCENLAPTKIKITIVFIFWKIKKIDNEITWRKLSDEYYHLTMQHK